MLHWLIESLNHDAMVHWLTHSSIHLIFEPLIHWLIDSLIQWFTASLIHWFIASLVHWLTGPFSHWFIDSLARCFTESLSRWTIDGSLICCFIVSLCQCVVDSLDHCHCFCDSLIGWFFGLLIRWPTGSLNRWILDSQVYSMSCAAWIHSFHGHLNNHLLILLHFAASAPQKLSYIGHWFPIAMFDFRTFRPGMCRALYG